MCVCARARACVRVLARACFFARMVAFLYKCTCVMFVYCMLYKDCRVVCGTIVYICCPVEHGMYDVQGLSGGLWYHSLYVHGMYALCCTRIAEL